MTISIETKRKIYWGVTIVVTILIAIVSTVYSLTHGIYDVFPFLYFLPIILFVYFYPNRGVIFSVFISAIFLILVYYFANLNLPLLAVSTAWFVIFVTIGVVTSSFAEGLREEERKYRGIFENSQAGIFTFELSSLLINEMNGKCARMLKYDREDLIGKNLSRILQDTSERDRFLTHISQGTLPGDMEMYFARQDGVIRQFLITSSVTPNNVVICSAIDITERKLAEQVIAKSRDELERRVAERTSDLQRANAELSSEIQERKRFEAAIQLANRKLNTLSNITRHDILNQITAIVMYLSLTQEMVKDPEILEHLKKIEQVTQLIQNQIQFTRDYQHIGSSAPQWENVASVIDDAVTDLDLKGISIEQDIDNLELYVDSLFVKVIYNLVENTLRHGEHATVIRFSTVRRGEDLALVYEDNGVGVPAAAKGRIFKREYFRNTGYGLFLASEILSITGITILENGETGKGARFEINVPKGAFRFTK